MGKVGRKADFKVAKRQENDDELLAQDWLKVQGYEDIRRPSSDPPDFVVAGKFAVEVTRLSQEIIVGADMHSRAEEQARIPLTNQIETTIEQLGPPGNEGRSWIINCEYDFSVPLPKPRKVSAQISDALAPLLAPYDHKVVAGMHARHFDSKKHAGELAGIRFPHLCLECGICLDLEEFSHAPEKFLVPNVSDGEGIGIAEELEKGIANRIRAKSETIRNQNRIGHYRSWWLVLVDHVCLMPMQMLSEHELSFVRDQEFDFWDRVIVVSSKNVNWHYDLRS